MRGSRCLRYALTLQVGIIPAHAGLTNQNANNKVQARDHPRACGAHENAVFLKVLLLGSSPRMRGSHARMVHHHSVLGIIPAHAGLTIVPLICVLMTWDHPRACGAHLGKNADFTNAMGSSPRMRGSLHIITRFVVIVGIIPAHAGLTG